MDNIGASYDEGDKNSQKYSQKNDSLVFNKTNSLMKFNSNMQIYEDVDIDKYMNLVEVELKKQELSLENRAFIANIITILDKLIAPEKFNKTIFFHILDFAKLNRDSPILILDFFKSFFTAYESMKKNRERFAQMIIADSQSKENYRNKYFKLQREEKLLQNGLTSNSYIKVKLLNVTIDQNDFINYKNHKGHKFLLRFKYGDEAQNLSTDILNKIIKFKLTSLEQIEAPLRIFLDYDGVEIYVGKINIRDCLESQMTYKFSHQAIIFEISFIWINSKVNYYNKLTTEYESKIEEKKENVHILNNCITHIEGMIFI
jgi:hypothetical protein